LVEAKKGDVLAIALDGKTLRGSFDHLNDQKAAQAMMAFASPSAIVLAHTEIAEKSNEIPAAEQMIGELGLSGILFTADALHCQKNIRSRQRQRQCSDRPGQSQSADLARHPQHDRDRQPPDRQLRDHR
jgi:hypothetical protein